MSFSTLAFALGLEGTGSREWLLNPGLLQELRTGSYNLFPEVIDSHEGSLSPSLFWLDVPLKLNSPQASLSVPLAYVLNMNTSLDNAAVLVRLSWLAVPKAKCFDLSSAALGDMKVFFF